jgi:hypothetical protein
MEEWCHLFPRDVKYERTFYTQKVAEKRAKRVAWAEKRRRKTFIEAQLNGQSTIDNDNDRWDNLFLTTEVDTASSSLRRVL